METSSFVHSVKKIGTIIKHIKNLKIGYTAITNMEDKVKNLGVIFDSRLSFEHHIKSLCSRLNGTLSYPNQKFIVGPSLISAFSYWDPFINDVDYRL